MRNQLLLGLAAALLLSACGRPFPRKLPEWRPIPEPDPDSVETVVFLIGDSGEAHEYNSPPLLRLREDVEHWAARLDRDSAVSVVVLGDIIYPTGLSPRGTPTFPEDSSTLYSQIGVVAGPAAREQATPMFFVPGNHDWAKVPAPEGLERLEYMDEELDAVREATGLPVRMLPEAGRGGPAVVDLGRHIRLLLLDTAWWLFTDDPAAKDEVIAGVGRALRTGGDRAVVIGAHHPWQTGGSHGGLTPFWETLGVLMLLKRTGAILQDINSLPFKQLRLELRELFEELIPPLVWVGGHDHSLQVFGRDHPADPRHVLVSGSFAKLSDVGDAPWQRFRRSEPGYMRLMALHDGDILLFVEAAPERYQFCEDEDPVERARCLRRGADAFRTVYSARLR